MSLLHLLILALVQGLTEFLPISSSAHLELLHKYAGPTDQDLALDVAVHVGTLGAVMVYFWREVRLAVIGFFRLLKFDLTSYETHLAICLIIATVPVVVLGAILKVTGMVEALRSLTIIGWAMILFGLLLWWMDRNAAAGKTAREWTMKDAWAMGLWQALALIPGTSRSGVAITGALARGYSRVEGARLAMLMSIPTIAASGVLLGTEVISSGNWSLGADILIGTALAFAAGLAALALMLRFLQTFSFTPYVVYRVVVGAAILWIAYT